MPEGFDTPQWRADALGELGAGGVIDACAACVRVVGVPLDADVVGDLLGFRGATPADAGTGDPGLEIQLVRTERVWRLETGRVNGGSLDALINVLLDRLTEDHESWRALAHRYRIDMFCAVHVRAWNRGLQLRPLTLRRLADRGLSLGLDIYVR